VGGPLWSRVVLVAQVNLDLVAVVHQAAFNRSSLEPRQARLE
jgi:hypothetical protein